MSPKERNSPGDNLVLVVDDTRLNREVLGQMVRNIGLEAVFAENGEEAIAQYHALKPSLILMDINMPGIDGIEAARQIKRQETDRFIPIIFVTGAEGQDVIRNAIDAGGDDFIQRPFPFELLEGKIVALRRIAQLYREVIRLNRIRAREEEVAEQLFSGAVESANVATDQIHILKKPAEVFSGDVQLSAFRPNGDLNVLLGDFTGHGLTSTVGALPLSETFRAMTSKGYEAEDILAQINRKLTRLLPTGMFLAVAMVTIGCDGSAKIWNGGLPDVAVIGNGEVKHRVTSSHPPLGILKNLGELHFDLFNIDATDHILMISDGVIEAENEAGEMYGEERLCNALNQFDCASEASLVDHLLADLTTFVAGEVQRDDISMISIPGHVVAPHQRYVSTTEVEVDDADSKTLDVWNWNIELKGKSLARINPVAQALSRLQETEGNGDHWHSVFTVLTELYVNALDHGVLQLESSLKASPEGFAQYFSEREKRLDSLQSGSVALYLQHTRLSQGGQLVVKIEDSGDGFDYQRWLAKLSMADSVEEGSGQLSGRGIKLVQELCQSLSYTDHGSTVEIVYHYNRETQA